MGAEPRPRPSRSRAVFLPNKFLTHTSPRFTTERLVAGGKVMEVATLRITDAGMKALAMAER